MNSCRDLLALFPLHELFIYHARLIQTIPSDKHCHAPVCTESPSAACPSKRRRLSPSARGLKACSTITTQLLEPQHLVSAEFLFRSLQFLGLGAGLLTSSVEQPLQVADAKRMCVCPIITHGISPTRFCCRAATARIDSLQHLLASECTTSLWQPVVSITSGETLRGGPQRGRKVTRCLFGSLSL